MASGANHAGPASIKRSSSSRRSLGTLSDVTQETTRSQHSSGTTAFYRYAHLAAAEVYVHTDPPSDIQKAINDIIKAEPSAERRDQLKGISTEFHDSCKTTVQAAVSEGDFVGLFLGTLKAMNHASICLRTQATWREELKPTAQQSNLNLSFVADQQREVDASAPPQKRLQQVAGFTYISPQPSMTDTSDPRPENAPLESGTMLPPQSPSVPEKEGVRYSVKTPIPDVSMGIEIKAFISALSSSGFNHFMAKRFLTQLQDEKVLRKRGEPKEPMLITVPSLRASDLVFPFAVLEGKADSTGRQVFEAENQAAVSGACGLKIQLCLDELVEQASSSDVSAASSKLSPPLFFSICTQGPIHELWAHYTLLEDGVRTFNQTLLKICHGVLRESVDEFIIAVDNVCHWGTGTFLNSVAERLKKVATRAGA